MNSQIILSAVGDIIPGDHPLYFGVGTKSLINKNKKFIFEFVGKFLSKSEIVFGNLETIISDTNISHKYKNLIMRGNPNFIQQIKGAHFNILNIANNHIQQHGLKPMTETIDILKKNNIKIIGMDKLQPQIIVCENIKFGFLGYSLHQEQFGNKTFYSYGNKKKFLSDVTKLKPQIDYLIISLHWGNEYIEIPSKNQIELAHQLIDSGVNVILGHHPHVLQPIEKYHHGIIAYSLGNFVSDMCQEKTKQSIILNILFNKKKDIEFEVIPIYINKNYQPEPAENIRKQNILSIVNNQEHFLLSQKDYQKKLKHCLKKNRHEYKIFLLKTFYKFPIKNLLGILSSTIKRKIKNVF